MTTPRYLVFHLTGCATFGVELKTDNDDSTLQYAIVKTSGHNTPPLKISTEDPAGAQVASLTVTTNEINLALAAGNEVDLQIWLDGALQAGDNAYIQPTFGGASGAGGATVTLSIEAASPITLTSGLETPIG